MPRRSAAAVADTRATVVELAVRQASITGLEGLTIGRLADDAQMSKSGLFGLFGSREELQLATLAGAIEQFTREVWEPVARRRPGLERLEALIDRWLGFHERDLLPGGCVLTTAIVEFDARPGPQRDAVAAQTARWLGVLEHDVRRAVEAGELPSATDPADVAFTLNALSSAASTGFRLSGDHEILARARRTMRATLGLIDVTPQ